MSSALIPAAFAILTGILPLAGDEPRAVVRHAVNAVEGDSVPRVRARWAARLERDPTDRAALLGLATLARLGYDYATAERLYRQLFSSDPPVRDGYAVYGRLGFAEGLEARSFGAAALTEFNEAREAARTAGDRTAEGHALLWLTFSRGRLQGVPVAEATLDSAASLIPDSVLSLQAGIADRRAILYSLRGRTDAGAEAERSIALARRAGDLRAEADGFRTLGKVLQYAGSVDSALIVLRRAEELYERAGNRSALATSLIWQAQVLGATARFGEMRAVMERARREGEATHNPAAVADAHRAFGTLAIMLGDFASAAENLERAASIARETGDASGLRTTQKFLVDVMIANGKLAESRQLVHDLLARATEPREEFELRDALVAIAIGERDWLAAERALAGARTVVPRLSGKRYAQWLLHDEARLALARGDLPAAERALLASIRAATDYSGDLLRADAHLRLADIYSRGGDLERAERELTASLDELEAWRARSSDADVRVFAFQVSALQHASSSEKGEQAARVARVIAALARGGRTDTAFALAERRRARELGDRFLRAESMRTAPASTRAAARDTQTAAPATARDIAAALVDDRTALLEFVGAARGAPTTVFIVQRSGIVSRTLAVNDSLGERIARLVALLEGGADATSLARALGAALLEPALAALHSDVERLIIVPDGMLHRVPWDALRLPDGRFVAERYALSVGPSAAVAATLWRRPADRSRAVRLLAFGDPAFARERTATPAVGETYRRALDTAAALPRLRGSAAEARLAARYAPEAELRLRRAASAAYLKRASLAEFTVIHFATHALVDDQSVAGTALALAPGEGENGFVGPGDLAALELDADLVVLSACRTARGVLVGGEGVQGLTASFLQAGARAVLATHWQIGDRGTKRFIEGFYNGLARGLTVADALRQAKLDAIRRGAPPRDWAGFTLVGDPSVVVAVQQPSRRAGWAAAALVLFLTLAAALIARMRARRVNAS